MSVAEHVVVEDDHLIVEDGEIVSGTYRGERLALEGRDKSVTPSAAKEYNLRREGRKSSGSGFVNIYS